MSASTTIKIKMYPITNPATQGGSESFTLVTYTSSSLEFMYDKITGGLIPNYGCTLPCKTCNSVKTSQCYSCFTDVDSILEKYLYSQKCLTACPSGYYADSSYTCIKCDETCLTCKNGTSCASCNTAGAYPYFYNAWSLC